MSFDSPKPRREAKVDLTGLSEHQVLVRRFVISLGEMVYGRRWQTDLAKALSEEAGRKIAQAQVSHWVAGRSPVPEGLVEPLQRLAIREAESLEHRAREIRAAWGPPPPEEDEADLATLAPGE